MGQFKRQDVTETSLIDPSTGEVTGIVQQVKTTVISKPVKEEKFVKVYYDALLAIIGKNATSLSDFLIAVGKYMVTVENTQIIELSKFKKEIIAREIGKSLATVERMITTCVQEGLFVKVGKGRSAAYAVSPFIISRSNQKEIHQLRVNYEAAKGIMEISGPESKKDEIETGETDEK